ncbi:MAG: DUF2807 domain-containing protein [Flavobacteriales bacterium]|nr:DUF2807 domain-containing protein [Flavobacteriales bacterium]
MKRPDEHENTLGALRELPPEVSLDQVQHMVAAFPIAVGLTAWLATAKIHLNSIVMTTAGTLIVGTSAYFFSTAAPTAPAERAVLTVPTEVVEMPAPAALLEEPAVVLDLPRPKPAAPAPKPEPKEEIACTVLSPEDTMRYPAAMPYPGATAYAGTAAYPGVAPTDPVAPEDPLASVLPPATVYRPLSNERSFDLRDFTGVTVASSMDVTVEIGAFSVVAMGDADMLQQLDVRNEQGMLKIGYAQTRGSYRNRGSVHIAIRMPRVDDLVVTGSGSIHAQQLVRTRDLDLNVLGSGNILLDRVDQVDALNMNIEGSGGIHLAMLGNSERLKMDILGSGGIYLSAAQRVSELDITMQGSGSVDVAMAHVSGTSRIKLLGSGTVRIGGETGRVEIALEGSGDVNANDLKASQGGKVHVLGSGNAHVYSDGRLELLTKGTGTIHTSGSAGLKGSRGVGSGAE